MALVLARRLSSIQDGSRNVAPLYNLVDTDFLSDFDIGGALSIDSDQSPWGVGQPLATKTAIILRTRRQDTSIKASNNQNMDSAFQHREARTFKPNCCAVTTDSRHGEDFRSTRDDGRRQLWHKIGA